MAYTQALRQVAPPLALPKRKRSLVYILAPPILATWLLWHSSPNVISPIQGACALVLILVPWVDYYLWKRNPRHALPLFPFVAFFYWVYFGLALFWGDRVSPTMTVGFVYDSAVTQSMIMAVVGVVSLWIGMKTNIGARWAIRWARDIVPGPNNFMYLRVLLGVGAVLTVFPDLEYLAGEQGRQIMVILQSTVPVTVFAYMFQRWLRGQTSTLDKYVMGLFFAASMLVALGSGWLGSSMYLGVACMGVYLIERRKLPLLPIALAVLYVVFFQAGKAEFRQQYWAVGTQNATGSVTQRIVGRFDSSLAQWEATLTGQGVQVGPELLHDSIMRLSLLTQTANVVELTPQVVPYQNGASYSYVAVGLIPRFLWPDKPSANDANRFYQVAYRLSPPSELNAVSMSAGTLTEAYFNFGWPGVVIVMFLLGILFDFLQETFLTRTAGLLFNAIGISILLRLIVIESQMSVYVGGLVESVLLVIIVLWPVSRTLTASEEPAETAT